MTKQALILNRRLIVTQIEQIDNIDKALKNYN